MSIRTLKREFYIPPSKWTKANALDCVLQKYIGTRPAALERHGVQKIDNQAILYSPGETFVFCNSTCALCKFYDAYTDCKGCPLATKSGRTCFDAASPFQRWFQTGDPEPMIRALRRAIKKQAAQRS